MPTYEINMENYCLEILPALLDHHDFDQACRYADKLRLHIEQESDESVILKSGLSYNPSEFYRALGQVYGCVPDMRGQALECYNKANLYSVIVHPEIVKRNRDVYSFRICNGYTYQDLSNRTIAVVSPLKMNDPSDTLLFDWEQARERVCREYDILPQYKEVANRMFKSEDIFRQSLSYYRIRSFSEKSESGRFPYQNTLMWSHYADSHAGICIQYSLSPEMQAHKDRDGFKCLRKVNYTDAILNLLADKEIDGEKALCCKHKDWEYENEVRLLTYLHHIEGDHYSIPVDEGSKIVAVYFGLKCPDEDISQIKRILCYDPGIRFYKMEKDYSDIYNLAITSI